MTQAATEDVRYTRQHVADYYDQCWSDYRFFWFDRESYAFHFGFWDESTRSHRASLLNMNRLVQRHARVGRDDLVLDAGCGIGGTAMWFAREHQARAMAITISTDQIRRGRELAQRGGLAGRVAFTCQDFSRTAFRSGTFHAVFSIEAACYAADKQAFLREAFRVLRPGGRLVIVDAFEVAPVSAAKQAIGRSWLPGWLVPNLFPVRDVETWAREAGFKTAELVDITPNVAPSCKRLHHVAALTYPAERLMNLVGMRTDVQHGNVVASINHWRAVRCGSVIHGLLSAEKP